MESELTPYNLASYDWLNQQNNKFGEKTYVVRWLCLSKESKEEAREGLLNHLKSQGLVQEADSIKDAEKTISEMFEQNTTLIIKYWVWKEAELQAKEARNFVKENLPTSKK